MQSNRPKPYPSPEELAAWTPPQVDEMVASVWGDIYNVSDDRDRALRYIADYRKQQAAGRPVYDYQGATIARYEKARDEADARLVELRAEQNAYEDEYRRRRWTRYFHVDNNNGHVHTSMNCSTCFVTTRYAWLTELSGQDEDACVALVGETACTVCMPSAPVKPGYGDGRSGWARRTAEQQAEKDREKAAKDAAKEAKAIYDVDGSPLRVDGWVIKTLVAAKQSLTDAVERAGWDATNPTYKQDRMAERDQLAAAIAHKTGDPLDKVIADAQLRADKRAKRYR
jgi:hypothetical protein